MFTFLRLGDMPETFFGVIPLRFAANNELEKVVKLRSKPFLANWSLAYSGNQQNTGSEKYIFSFWKKLEKLAGADRAVTAAFAIKGRIRPHIVRHALRTPSINTKEIFARSSYSTFTKILITMLSTGDLAWRSVSLISSPIHLAGWIS